MQTFTFLTSVPSSSRFTAVDPLSQIATSFSFGAGKYDFSPLMVYVLVANGDIYSMGPVLPVHAEIPQRYLQALRAHTEGRSRRIQEEESKDDESTARVERIALQVQWLDSLAKQIKQAEEARRRRVDDEWATPSRQNNFQSQRHRRTNSNLPDDLRRTTNDGTVRIHPPHLTETGGPAPGMHRGCMRQGPMVFSPGPSDLGYAAEEQEQVASDLCIFSSEVGPMQRDKQAEIGDARDTVTVVAIAWSSGRVDLGVELEKVEPRWISSRARPVRLMAIIAADCWK